MNVMRFAPVLLIALLSGCPSGGGSKSSASSKASARPDETSSKTAEAPASNTAKPSSTAVTIGAPSSSGVVIAFNPDGPNPLDESKLHGDPAACKKVKSCCDKQSGSLALSCQMAIVSENGDCAKVADSVKKVAKELGKPPPGCD
jgi:hypothetical protein